MKRRSLRLGRARVVYREAGQGLPVILVSGLGLSGRFYTRSYDAFAEAGLRLVVPDLPGFGSSSGWRARDVGEVCAFLLAFADALDIDRAAWLGHSVGAQPAIRIAAAAPHRAHALVLAGPTGSPHPRRALRQAIGLAREAVRAPLPVVLHVLGEYARTAPTAYAGTWLRFTRDQPIEQLGAIRCPAQLVVGTRDPVVDAAFLELLLRRVPTIELVRVAGGTHALPRSDAAAFNQAVTRFLRRVAAQAA